MKNLTRLFVLLLAAVLVSSCSSLAKMKKNADKVQYEVTPKVLEAHGGMVAAQVKATYPAKYFDKKATLKVTPVLTYEGGETAFDQLLYAQGEQVQSNNKSISWTGGTVTWSGSIPYKPEMKVSEFKLKIEGTKKGKTLAFDPIKLADGVIATSTLVMDNAKGINLKDAYQRIIPDQKVADILYLINKSDIRPSELKAEDIAALKDYITQLAQDSTKKLTGLITSSYASPDGSLDLNTKLSEKRGETATKFVNKEFGKNPALADKSLLKNQTTAEDWDGFKTLVQESNMQDKDLILRVLSMYQDPAVREKEIKNMSSAFEVLATDVLPKLRRSKFIVDVNLIGLSNEQILTAMRSGNVANLTLEQMLYAGTLTTDPQEQLKFYQIATEKDPKCYRAWNNVGVADLNLGKADDAIVALETAKAIKNDDVVKNNLGFAKLVKGDLPAAKEYFNSMSASTAESNYGLGVIAIHEGNYDQAVNLLGTEPSFNLALAQILKGDLTKAKVTLDAVKPCKCGAPSYLKAVLGARLADRDYMLNNLREAVGYNAKWKDYAKTDLEFAKYFTDETFTSIVK
jgi:tetratricopeptide (TPR) repeat protein